MLKQEQIITIYSLVVGRFQNHHMNWRLFTVLITSARLFLDAPLYNSWGTAHAGRGSSLRIKLNGYRVKLCPKYCKSHQIFVFVTFMMPNQSLTLKSYIFPCC